MIRARLRPTHIPPEIPLLAYKNLLKEGRSKIATERLRARKRAHSYARFVRQRGFSKGYMEGLAAAQADYTQAMHDLRLRYGTVVEAAQKDTIDLAQSIAERFIEASAIENPKILAKWIEESLTILKHSRQLLITYHPRYERMMPLLAPALPEGISIQADARLKDIDFTIQGAAGGIEFAWRDAIGDRLS